MIQKDIGKSCNHHKTVPIWHEWASREYKGQRRRTLKEFGKMAL